MINTDELKQILSCDYFRVFGITPDFDLDQNSLAAMYRKQQQKYHPDNGLQYDNAVQALILSVSAHINSAFSNLKNPLARALLLLELNNTALDLAHDTALSSQFLMEQMEFHEELDAAKQTKDIGRLEKLEQTLKFKESHIIQQLSAAFKQQKFDKARDLSKQLAFYNRVLNQVTNTISSIW